MQTKSSSTPHVTGSANSSKITRLFFLLTVLLTTLSFAGALSAAVLINETDADTAGTDVLEFVELYDEGAGNTALDGLVLVFYNGSNNLSYSAFDLDGFSTDANGYFLLGNSGVVPTPSILFASNGLQNGADAVALYSGDATDFPNDTAVTTTNLLDAIVYDTNDSDDAELLVLLNAGQPQVNEDGGGDKDNHSNQRCPNGSGGAQNTTSYSQFAPTPGAENCVAPPLPPILINEVDADQTGTDSAEFIELYDGGAGNTPLDGLVLVLMNGSDDASYNAFDLDGQSTNAAGYFVLCGNAANTVNCDMDVAPDTDLVQNGADAVALYSGNAADFPNDTPVSTTNLLDAIVYDTNDGDDAGLLVLLNAGQPQVNEDGDGDKDNHSNQRCPNGSGGERNTSTYTQFAPTPGAENCAEPPSGSVFINEVDADQTGTDSAEFIELYDGGAGNTALNGLVLVLMNGSDDASYNAFDLDGQSTNASGYFVLCGNAANTVNCDMDVAPDTDLVQNGADAVALYAGNATDFPNDTPVTTTNLIDAIVYDTNDGDDAGLLVLLNAAQPQVNEGGAGDKDIHSNQRCPNGSGGVRNTDTYGQFDPTPGLANLCGAAPPVLINEVDADQTSTDSAEFIELYDGGTGNTPLDGKVLVLINGSDDASYLAFDLDGQSTNANGYFVLCGNAANTVNCDMDVAPDTDLIQNGADAVALYTGDAADFPNDTPVTTANLLDALVYDTSDSDDAGLLVLLNAGQEQVNENGNGAKDTESNQRCPNGAGGERNTATYTQFAPTPGTVNCEIPPMPEMCGDPVTPIHEIQGAGLASPLDGMPVSIEGIVVGDFQDGGAGVNGDLNGFFVQEEDAQADADPNTSEGIFVFDGFSPAVDVNNGDRVRVSGTVDEFNELTEITSTTFIDVCDTGQGLPATTAIILPRTSVDDWEATEGMRVTFPQTLYVTSNFTLARFGEIELSVDAPLDNPTNVVAPGAPAIALQDLNDVSRIQLDDGSSVQNPLPLPPYLDADGTRRVGDSTTGLTGVLSYSFGSYDVQPTTAVEFVGDNERPLDPPDVGGSLIRVAGFNVLNYFTTLDNGGPICGPLADQNCRGADNADEFTRQRTKLVSALTTLNADVVGLIELENAADNTPIADLVDGLNAVLGAGVYAYVDTNAIGDDAIRQGIIYKPANVTAEGPFEVLDSTDDPLFDDTRNRPVLAQTFSENSTGEKFTVAVNHLKSKGSDCDDVGDPDTGDGQGECNLTRTSGATALVDWLATDPTASGDSDRIIVGDLNAYAMEDPIMAIMAGGYVDLINAFVGTGYADGAYSFSFSGQAGYLDHALASPSLLAEVSGAATWHINSDEPVALDYNNEFNQPALYNPDQFRSSDHDAVVVGLFIDADEDGVWDATDVCPNTVIPESVPTKSLGTNRFALLDGDGVFDTKPPEGKGPQESFDIYDTAGCSCEQIIDAQGLGEGHRKHGCSVGVMKNWVELVTAP